MANKYEDLYEESIKNPERFWAKAGKLVSWTKPWTKVMDNSIPTMTKWFVGGELNACYNAVDRHVEAGNGHKKAIIYNSPVSGSSRILTYSELLEKVSKLAGKLSELGVQKNDRVLIYMPVIPETAIAMLATVRLGAIHCVVFGGFASVELRTRIEHVKPKVIIAANCALESDRLINYTQFIKDALSISSHLPQHIIIYERKNLPTTPTNSLQYHDWETSIKTSSPAKCVSVEANHPLYILHTSGSTGEPKGIVRPTGGHLVALTWTMKAHYGMGPDDTWWTTSDFGWVLGHSYMCYAPLLSGITTVIYEGKPDPLLYFQTIKQYGVNGIFTIPSILRTIQSLDSQTRVDVGSLRFAFVAGEPCDSTTKANGEKFLQVPIFNNWWQTETGHPITGYCVRLENSVKPTPATAGLPLPGYKVEIVREDGSQADRNESGRIVLKLPLPPGALSGLYRANERLKGLYFSKHFGYYDSMDSGYIDEHGLIYVTSRMDDVINVAGHRISTLSIEEIVLSHPEVREACVVSVPHALKNEVPFCFFVIREGSIMSSLTISGEILEMVRAIIGPVASLRMAAAIRMIPRTRSGKVCRKAISDIARDRNAKAPSTIVDASIFKDICTVFRTLGFYNTE